MAFDLSNPENLQIPDISRIVGPTLQREIADANKAVLRLYVAASRLSSAEPLAASLLGVDQKFLNVFAHEVAGRESVLAASYGFPIFEPRIKDSALLLQIAREGCGNSSSIAELTRTFPLPVIERATRRFKRA